MMTEQLAQYLNVNKTSFNRELARMKEEGIIDIDGHNVRLLVDLDEVIAKCYQ